MQSSLPPLHLKRREDRRIRAGHAWVYSNEVDVERTPLTAFEPGAPADLHGHSGAVLGSVQVNPHALICARLVSRLPGVVLDRDLLATRLKAALALRERLFDAPGYRLVYGESDGLPGLVVDRYREVLVVQVGTAGMECLTPMVLDVLEDALAPECIVLRNDGAARELEGLAPSVSVARGRLPDTVLADENGLSFEISAVEGQKTGWYYDQRPNRARVGALAGGSRVLDLYCYGGGFAIAAARGGAESVLAVDASEPALALAARNVERNGVADRVELARGDAVEVLKGLRAQGRRFDLVVLDPPAFIRRRRDVEAGLQAYRRLNRLAMTVLAPDALLVSASCSSHLRRDRLRDLLRVAAAGLGRELQILEQGFQGADHPVLPGLPETEYLKLFVTRVRAG